MKARIAALLAALLLLSSCGTQATDYPRWVATLDAALHGGSLDELHKVYVRNAESFYRV